MPATVAVGYYFTTKRALATGIAVCGSGVGTFVFAPFCQFLLTKTNWQGSMLILSFLVLACVGFGSLLKPLGFHAKALHEDGDEEEEEKPKMKSLRVDPESSKPEKATPEPELTVAFQKDTCLFYDGDHSREQIQQPAKLSRAERSGPPEKTQQPKLTLQHNSSSENLQRHRRKHRQHHHHHHKNSSHHRINIRPMSRKDIFYEGSIRNIPRPNEPLLRQRIPEPDQPRMIAVPAKDIIHRIRTQIQENPEGDGICTRWYRKVVHNLSCCFQTDHHPSPFKEQPARHLMTRTGSVQLESGKLESQEETNCWTRFVFCFPCTISSSMGDILGEMMDFSLLKSSFSFRVLIVANIICRLGFYVPYVFITQYAMSSIKGGRKSTHFFWILIENFLHEKMQVAHRSRRRVPQC